MPSTTFPNGAHVSMSRAARLAEWPEQIIACHHDGLRRPVFRSFEDHAGHDDVMIGVPGARVHPEFARHHLHVRSVSNNLHLQRFGASLAGLGVTPVERESLSDVGKSPPFEAPASRRVVLFNEELRP